MDKEETFAEMMDRIQKKKLEKRTINLKIMYCPVNLYEVFVSDIHLYNDCFWAKLQDIIRKAECYDNLINVQNTGYMELSEQDKVCDDIDNEVNKNQDKESPLTIGDLKELRKKDNKNEVEKDGE